MSTHAITEGIEQSFDRFREPTLTVPEVLRLIGLCVELVDLCARVAGRLDPELSKLIACARDEMKRKTSSHE
jgi:hypothetical protein